MFRSVRGLGVAFSVLVASTALLDLVLAGWVWRVHGVLQDYVDGASARPSWSARSP